MDKVLHYITRCVTESVPVNLAFSWWAFWGDPKYRSVPMTHKWGYTYDSLQQVVAEAGYVQARIETPHYHFAERDMRVVCYKGAA